MTDCTLNGSRKLLRGYALKAAALVCQGGDVLPLMHFASIIYIRARVGKAAAL